MILFYVRHGDPIYNPDSLTHLGKKQAESVAKRLALYGIDSIFSSPSNRAIMTAAPLSELLSKEITTLDFCDESNAWKYFTVKLSDGNSTWCYQDFNTLKLFVTDEIYNLKNNWYEHKALKDYNFKEGWENLKFKTDEFLLNLGFKHNKDGTYDVINKNSDRVALFAHEGFGMIFLSIVLDIPYPLFCSHFGLNHSGMSVIYFNENEEKTISKLLTLSNDSHLYKDELPTMYNDYFSF